MRLRRSITCLASAVAVAGVLGSAPTATHAAEPTPPLSRSELREHAREIVANGAPGVQVTTRDEYGVRNVVEGVGNLRRQEPPRVGRQFRLGSVTKSFTATVVLSLVDDRRIRLDAPIARYLPNLLPYRRSITVRQLLEHRSGLFDYKSAVWPNVKATAASRFRDYTPADLVRIAAREPLQFAPGERFEYSNTDYVVLGMLVEKVTGNAYEHELWQRVLRPTHLRDTYVPGHDPRLRRPAARGYEDVRSQGGLTDLTRFNMSAAWASGDLVSTTADVNRFYDALLDGRLLSRKMLHAMKQSGPAFPGFGYGLGLGHLQKCGQQIWGHVGGVPGYNTFAFTNDSTKRQITIMVNRSFTLDDEASDAALALVAAEFCGSSTR
ncbi:beta-lactamase family protein [Nocardioidaceae bacterium SCSIO 66511]|nr:beta-lactamase family protein [Nocardioidaceae bacterium SCSIO 66511]